MLDLVQILTALKIRHMGIAIRLINTCLMRDSNDIFVIFEEKSIFYLMHFGIRMASPSLDGPMERLDHRHLNSIDL